MFYNWCLFLLYQWSALVGATTASTSTSLATTHTAVNSTCPSRTANYLTHTLPQQCLTTSRNVVTTSTCNSTHADIPTTAPATISSAQPQSLVEVTPTEQHNVTSTIASAEIAETSSDLPASVMTVTARAVSNQALVPALPDMIEEESSLEGGGFLSFEEWKKRNLKKAGQSEHVGRAASGESREGRQRQVNVGHSLDSLGDDVEIDLDFTGFVPGGPGGPGAQPLMDPIENGAHGVDPNAKPNVGLTRNKDAGTTCKERFNYASFDCAANMLKTNPQAKSPGSVLVENKDVYMLNECSAENKFIILELCNDILVDTVVLANFEFFSSIFRTFRVSVSDRYPVKLDKWKTLGTFEARNTREVQAFLIENPMIWARYLRIEFLTHYGAEYYCPVSLVRVHGTTMLEEYKHDLAATTADEEEESESGAVSTDETEVLVPEAIDHELAERERQQKEAKEKEVLIQRESPDKKTQATATENESTELHNDCCMLVDIPANVTLGIFDYYIVNVPDEEMCMLDEAPSTSEPATTNEVSPVTSKVSSSVPIATSTKPSTITSDGSKAEPSQIPPVKAEVMGNVSQPTRAGNGAETSNQSSIPESSTSNAAANSSSSALSERSKTSSTGSSEKSRQTGSGTQPPPASPTTQESFFKSVQKRLQMLESNSTLSLQYIEEQSRALRDAFIKVEQRQLAKTSLFLDHLNATVFKELREFRQQYDQLWQSTVIELTIQREQYQRENQAMNARLGVLADELIFQKRMSILQMTLILVCLGLVLFSRGVINNYLELPLVQSVLSRSPSSRWMNLSGDTSSPPPKLTRARSAYQMVPKPNGILKGHRRLQSDDSNLTDAFSTSEIYSPPTPASYDGYSDASQSLHDDSKLISDPEFDPETIERPSTSPPVLSSPSEPATPRLGDEMKFPSIGSQMITPGSSNEHLVSPSDRITRSMPSSPPPPTKHLTWDLPDT